MSHASSRRSYEHAYVAFFRVSALDDDKTTAIQAAAHITVLDTALKKHFPKPSQRFATVFGAFALNEQSIDELLTSAENLRQECYDNDVTLSVGVSHGRLDVFLDLSGTPNVLGRPVNIAARLAGLPDGRGHIAMDEQTVTHVIEAGFSSEFGPPSRGKIKKDELQFRLLTRAAECLIPSGRQLPEPKGAVPFFCYAIVYDLPDFTQMGDRATTVVNNLVHAVYTSLRSVNMEIPSNDVLYAPGGDGGAIILPAKTASTLVLNLLQTLISRTEESNARVRIGLATGQAVRSTTDKNRPPVGPAILRADANSREPEPSMVCLSHDLAQKLANILAVSWAMVSPEESPTLTFAALRNSREATLYARMQDLEHVVRATLETKTKDNFAGLHDFAPWPAPLLKRLSRREQLLVRALGASHYLRRSDTAKLEEAARLVREGLYISRIGPSTDDPRDVLGFLYEMSDKPATANTIQNARDVVKEKFSREQRALLVLSCVELALKDMYLRNTLKDLQVRRAVDEHGWAWLNLVGQLQPEVWAGDGTSPDILAYAKVRWTEIVVDFNVYVGRPDRVSNVLPPNWELWFAADRANALRIVEENPLEAQRRVAEVLSGWLACDGKTEEAQLHARRAVEIARQQEKQKEVTTLVLSSVLAKQLFIETDHTARDEIRAELKAREKDEPEKSSLVFWQPLLEVYDEKPAVTWSDVFPRL